MGKTLYLCKGNGDIFAYIPEHEESSEVIKEKTDYIFTAFNGTDGEIEAFACGYNITAYSVIEDSGRSSESSESFDFLKSESSISEDGMHSEEDEYSFYVIRRLEYSEKATLSCYSIYGELLAEFEIPISEKIMGMEVWPKDGNTIVITSQNNIYVVNLKSGIPSIIFSEASKKLTRGIAYKSGFGNDVSFWIGLDEGQFKKRAEITINKNTANNNVLFVWGTKISRDILGITNYLGRAFLAFEETDASKSPRTYIWDPSGSKDTTIPVSCIDIASGTSACAYLYPFQENYLDVETIEYDPITGEKISVSDITSFGAIASGDVSQTKVLRLNVPWAKTIKNIKLGLTDASLITRFYPGIIKFGTSPNFISEYQPSENFNGINDTGSADDQYNKSIQNSSYPNGTISDYIYLSISLPAKYFGSGNFQFKWFFDVEIYEDELIVPDKICYYNENSFSSESTFSSDFVCQAGTQYLNDAVDPISFSGGIYSWNGGQWNTSTQGHANIRRYCDRVLVYENVYHNGSTYILNTPYVVTPWSGGIAVPDKYPFRTPCWNYVTYKGNSWCTPPAPWSLGDVGSSTTFTIDPKRLFRNLITENGLEIPSGVFHALALEIQTWALEARKPCQFIVQGRIIIYPKAYYHREEIGHSSSSSET